MFTSATAFVHMPFFGNAPSYDSLVLRFGDRYKWLALMVVGLGTVAAVLSTTSFSVAVPALGRHFGLGQEQVQWAITGFMGAMTVAMLPTPWLLDRIGFRRCFLIAIVMLAVTSIAGSLSTRFSFVVAARVLQGAAAGLLQPLATLAVMRLFPVETQGRASGVLGFGIVLAPAVAPAFGGVLLDHFGWQAIFLINVPLCLVAGVAGIFLLPKPREIHIRAFDWFGVGLLGLVTVSLVEGVASLQHSGPAAPWTLFQFGAAVAAGAAFGWHGRRAKAPIVNLGLFRERSFAMGTLVFFSYGFGLYASTYLIPVFLQSALGFSATAAGFALMPSGIVLAITIPVAGRLADKYSPQWITVTGLSLFGLSFLLFSLLGHHLTYGELVFVTIIGRIGLGLILPALSLAALRHMEPHQLGQSSMVTSYLRQLGGVLGIAMAAVFVEWRQASYGPAGVISAYSEGFMLLAIIFGLALVAASWMRPLKRA